MSQCVMTRTATVACVQEALRRQAVAETWMQRQQHYTPRAAKSTRRYDGGMITSRYAQQSPRRHPPKPREMSSTHVNNSCPVSDDWLASAVSAAHWDDSCRLPEIK